MEIGRRSLATLAAAIAVAPAAVAETALAVPVASTPDPILPLCEKLTERVAAQLGVEPVSGAERLFRSSSFWRMEPAHIEEGADNLVEAVLDAIARGIAEEIRYAEMEFGGVRNLSVVIDPHTHQPVVAFFVAAR